MTQGLGVAGDMSQSSKRVICLCSVVRTDFARANLGWKMYDKRLGSYTFLGNQFVFNGVIFAVRPVVHVHLMSSGDVCQVDKIHVIL